MAIKFVFDCIKSNFSVPNLEPQSLALGLINIANDKLKGSYQNNFTIQTIVRIAVGILTCWISVLGVLYNIPVILFKISFVIYCNANHLEECRGVKVDKYLQDIGWHFLYIITDFGLFEAAMLYKALAVAVYALVKPEYKLDQDLAESVKSGVAVFIRDNAKAVADTLMPYIVKYLAENNMLGGNHFEDKRQVVVGTKVEMNGELSPAAAAAVVEAARKGADSPAHVAFTAALTPAAAAALARANPQLGLSQGGRRAGADLEDVSAGAPLALPAPEPLPVRLFACGSPSHKADRFIHVSGQSGRAPLPLPAPEEATGEDDAEV